MAQGIPIVTNDLPLDPVYVNTVLNVGVTLLNKSKWFNAITVYISDSTLVDSILALPYVMKLDTVGKRKNLLLDQLKISEYTAKWDLESVSGTINAVNTTLTGPISSPISITASMGTTACLRLTARL